jgi:hypothetical protein
MGLTLQDIPVSDLKLGTRASLNPDSFRDNFPRHGKVNVTQGSDNVVQIVVRYHNHPVAAYQTALSDGEELDRKKIQVLVTKKITNAPDTEVSKYIDALHKSQKNARDRKKSA